MIVRLLLVCFFFCGVAYGQTRVNLNGEFAYKEVSEGTEEIVFYAVSRTKQVSKLEISAFMPVGAKIRAFGAKLTGKPRKLLNKKRPFYELKLRTLAQDAAHYSGCVEISEGDDESTDLTVANYPPMWGEICDLMGIEALSEIALDLSTTTGEEWGVGNACSYVIQNSEDPATGGPDEWCALYDWNLLLMMGIDCFPDGLFLRRGGLQSHIKTYRAEFIKDTCKRKKRYLLKIIVDLKDVPAGERAGRVGVSVRESFKRRHRQASIKPRSEGRYAPKPIVLMNWLGNPCGSKITVRKWGRRKPKWERDLDIYSYLVYRGMVLALGVVDTVLTGGKGSFSLANGVTGYSSCFELKRRRQRSL